VLLVKVLLTYSMAAAHDNPAAKQNALKRANECAGVHLLLCTACCQPRQIHCSGLQTLDSAPGTPPPPAVRPTPTPVWMHDMNNAQGAALKVLPRPAAVLPAYKGRTRSTAAKCLWYKGREHAAWCAQDIAGCKPCANGSALLNLQPGESAAG
jgi:hypothetical protein